MVKHEQGASKGQDHTIVEYSLFKDAEMLGLIQVSKPGLLWWSASQNVVIDINNVFSPKIITYQCFIMHPL